MARIDAAVATQISDASRPYQSVKDAQEQSAIASQQEAARPEPRSLAPAKSDEIKAAVERLQTVIEIASGRQLNFEINDRFKELVVKISDSKSGEVLKEIPSKDFLKLRERLDDLIGLFINEEA